MTIEHEAQAIDPVAIRAAKGWSQAEMAEHLGCNQSTVSRIELGATISGPMRRLYLMLSEGTSSSKEPTQ